MPLAERQLQFTHAVVGHRRLSVEFLQIRCCLRTVARALFDVYERDVFLQVGQKFFQRSRLRMELHKDEERVALIFADDLSEIFDNALIASCIVFFLFAAATHFNDDGPSLRMVQKMFEILLLETGVFNAMNAVDSLPHKALVGVERTREKARHRHRRLRISRCDMVMHGMSVKHPALVLFGIDSRQFCQKAVVCQQTFRFKVRLCMREARPAPKDFLRQLESRTVCIVEVHLIEGIADIDIILFVTDFEAMHKLFACNLAQTVNGDFLHIARFGEQGSEFLTELPCGHCFHLI